MILTKDNFHSEVESSKGLFLVDFFALWCGPCQIMSPIIEEMIKDNKDNNVKIGKLNIDNNQDVAIKYNVLSIPTFLLFKDGKVVDRITGYCSKEDLLQLINKNK